MQKKQQNIEITPAVSDWYGKNFPSIRSGIAQTVTEFMDTMDGHPAAAMFQDLGQAHHFMMTAWRHMWRHSLAGIKGRFSRAELMLIIDIYNGTMLTPMHYGSNSLAVGISESIALDGMAEKWEVDAKSIIEKAKALSPTQSLCLELWANGFWYGKDQAKGLEDYVKILEAAE